jgi:hypothetical protein
MTFEYRTFKTALCVYIYDGVDEKYQKKIMNLIRENEKEFLTVLYEPYPFSFPGEFVKALLPSDDYKNRHISYFHLCHDPVSNNIFTITLETEYHILCTHFLYYPYVKLKKLSFFDDLKSSIDTYRKVKREVGKLTDELLTYIRTEEKEFPNFKDFIAHNICFASFLAQPHEHVQSKKQRTPPEVLAILNRLNSLF